MDCSWFLGFVLIMNPLPFFFNSARYHYLWRVLLLSSQRVNMAQKRVVKAKIKVSNTHFWHSVEANIFIEGTTRLKSASSSSRKNAREDPKQSFCSVFISVDLTFFSIGVTYFNHRVQNCDLGWDHQRQLLNGALVKHCGLISTLHGCG